MIPTELLPFLRIFMLVTGLPVFFFMDGVFIYYGRRISKTLKASPLADMLYTLMISIGIFMNICIWIVTYLMFVNIQIITYGLIPLYLMWVSLFVIYIRIVIGLYKTLRIDEVRAGSF